MGAILVYDLGHLAPVVPEILSSENRYRRAGSVRETIRQVCTIKGGPKTRVKNESAKSVALTPQIDFTIDKTYCVQISSYSENI